MASKDVGYTLFPLRVHFLSVRVLPVIERTYRERASQRATHPTIRVMRWKEEEEDAKERCERAHARVRTPEGEKRVWDELRERNARARACESLEFAASSGCAALREEVERIPGGSSDRGRDNREIREPSISRGPRSRAPPSTFRA